MVRPMQSIPGILIKGTARFISEGPEFDMMKDKLIQFYLNALENMSTRHQFSFDVGNEVVI